MRSFGFVAFEEVKLEGEREGEVSMREMSCGEEEL